MPRALVYTQDETLRRVLLRALRAAGVEGHGADEVGAARAQLAAGGFEAIVSDTGSPDGGALLQEALSGGVWRVRVGARRAGGASEDASLTAPFGLREVRAALGPVGAPESELRELDRRQLLDCVKGDVRALDALVEMFLQSAEEQLGRARAAGEALAMRQALHRLAGTASTAGAARLASLSRGEMEALAERPAEVEALAAALEAFRGAYARWLG